MPDHRILEQRREISQLARKLATEQGHYPPNAPPLQHEIDPKPETSNG